MKTSLIFFTQIIILIFSNLAAQKSTDINFLEDYSDHHIMSQIYLDDSTIITKTQRAKSAATIEYTILLTNLDLKNGKFSTEKVEIKSLSAYYLDIQSCIKLDGEILLIRADKAKKETQYFMDQFKSKQFIRAETPFFNGLTSEGYQNNFKISLLNNYLLMTFYDQYFQNHQVNMEFISQINFVVLDRNNFTILNKYTYNGAKFSNDFVAKGFTSSTSAEKFTVLYSVYNKKEDKTIMNLLVLDDSNLHQIQHEELGEVDNTILYSDSNIINLFIVSRLLTYWNSKLFSVNDILQLDQIDSKIIPFELLAQEYGPINGKIEKLDQEIRKIDYTSNFKAFRGENNALYLIQVGKQRVPENSYINSNLLITKIKDEKIEWNQSIRRHVRFQSIEGDIFEDETNLIIEDTEYMHLIDENGKFIPENDSKTVLSPEVSEINLVINKETGEFKRTTGKILKRGLFVTN